MRGRVRGGQGYLLIENRHSPVPLTLRLANGETLLIAAGETAELPTLTCCHCNCTVVLHPQRARPRAWCRKCNAYCCEAPGCNTECTPTLLCVDLAQKHADTGQDFLGRAKDGSPLFDRRYADAARIF